MKKMTTFAVVLMVAAAFTACGAKKQIAQQTTPQQQTQTVDDPNKSLEDKIKQKELEAKLRELERKEELAQAQHDKELAAIANTVVTYDVPCKESSFDDDDYFRDFGIGTVQNQNDQLARQVAAEAAKSMIKIRLAEYIQGVTDFYLDSYSDNKSDKDAAGNRLRRKMNSVVEAMLNNADKICENPGTDSKGIKHWYYAIQIPKKELNKKMMEIMSEEDKLKRDFDAEQMQKFMDERMAAMLEAKKNAGY